MFADRSMNSPPCRGGSIPRDAGPPRGQFMNCPYVKKARHKGRALSRVSRDARKLAQQGRRHSLHAVVRFQSSVLREVGGARRKRGGVVESSSCGSGVHFGRLCSSPRQRC